MTAATARIHAGMLDQRIKLQARAGGVDVLGQASGAWQDVAEVWARARPLRSRELFAAGTVGSLADVAFTVRWRNDITAQMRVLWRGKPYGVTGEPIDVDGQQQWLEIMATSGARDGR